MTSETNNSPENKNNSNKNLCKELQNNFEIHLYKISLEDFELYAENIQKITSQDEENRASQFVFDRDKKFYLLRRFFIRSILSRYTSIEPPNIAFEYNQYGKPFVKNNFQKNKKQIYFNMSHSKNLAICGVSNSDLGIDIEYIDYEANILNIKNTICSEKEIKRFFPEDELKESQIDKIYKLWSCKEAYIKLLGSGLFNDLKEIEIGKDFCSVSHSKHQNQKVILNPIYQEEKGYIAFVAQEINRHIMYPDFNFYNPKQC